MALEFILAKNTSSNISVADSKLYRNLDGLIFEEIDVDFIPIDIEVITDTKAIIYSSDGFKYTTDNGDTWADSVGLPSTISVLTDISSPAPNIVYVTENRSNIYKSSDGGATFAFVNSFSTQGITWADENLGYSVIDINRETRVYKTTDGGVSYSQVSTVAQMGTNKTLISFSTGEVYIYDNRFSLSTFKKSTDFGATFTDSPAESFETIKAIDKDTLYATTNSQFGGYLWVSTDGGDTFNPTTMPANRFAQFISLTEGYSAENGVIYKTTDLGLNFTTVPVDTVPGTPVAGTWFSNVSSGVGGVPGCIDVNAYNYNSNATADDGSCLFAFKLVNLATNSEIIVTNNLIGQVGNFVKIDGDDFTCYQVQYSNTIAGAIPVTLQATDYPDQATCELTIPVPGSFDPNAYNFNPLATVSDGSELYAYRLTDTQGVDGWKITNTVDDLVWQGYVGLVIKVSEYPDKCWLVSYETDITNDVLETLTYTEDYPDGATCELTLPVGYILTDVTGQAGTIVTDTDLSSYVGQVIKVNGTRICYSVALHTDVIGAIPVVVYNSFVDGDTCLLSLQDPASDCPEDEAEGEEETTEEIKPQPKPVKLDTYYQTRYKLDQIVREYIIERGEDTEHSYPRLLQLAVNGLRELNMDISGSNKMVVLSIKDDMTVDLPSDFINYTRIAICGSDGELMSLGHNPNLCKPRYADDCGNIVHKPSTSGHQGIPVYIDNIASHYRNGEIVGRFYGEGGGYNANGQYVLDKERGVLQLSSVLADEIVLEYVADLSKIDGNFVVHPYIIETVKAYMGWSSIRRKMSVNQGEKEMARRDYYNERRIAGLRFNSFTMEEAKATIRKAFKLSPKL